MLRPYDLCCTLADDDAGSHRIAGGHAWHAKLETANVDDAFVLNGICALISRIETYGLGAWQAAALTKCYELLGRYRKLFTERVELSVDDKIIERLEAARRRQEPPELTQ